VKNNYKDLSAWFVVCCVLFAILAPTTIPAETKKIVVRHGTEKDALDVVLSTTVDDYGSYELIDSKRMTIGRSIQSLVDNTHINFISFTTNYDREKQLLPIVLPLNDGLLGYRICLIKAGTQQKFDAIHSLEDWKLAQLSIGTGAHWSDTSILKANELKVITSGNYVQLIGMLAKGRVDCVSRGLGEVLHEAKEHQSKGIVIEENLLLVYPMRSLWFVSRKDPELAERIKVGYARALENGTWQAHVQQKYEKLQQEVKPLNLKERTLIYLENPFIPEKTKKLSPIVPFIQELLAK
jgi:hypothetical protein